MFRLRNLAIAGCILAICPLFVCAQADDLKAVLRKAVDAHGGEKNLSKFNAGTSKFKGTMSLSGLNMDVDGESWIQKPNKLKSVLKLDFNGKSVEIIRVYDGKKFWVSNMGNTKEIDDEKILKEVRESMQAEGGASLIEFQKKPFELSAIGEVKVKDKDAIGIRVSAKDRRDISYFFDKKTHMVVKIETRALDPKGEKEVTQEKFIMGYQDKNGVKIARRVVIHNDGELFMDFEITEAQVLEKHDDAIFTKP